MYEKNLLELAIQKSTLQFTIALSAFACNCIYVIYFYMAKINKTQSNKKLKLPNLKRRNNRVAVLKVHSIAMRLAYQMSGLRGIDLKNFPQYHKSTIYQHCKLPVLSEADCVDRRRNSMGRPKKLSNRDCRLVVRKISALRTTDRSFTSRRLQVISGLDHVSNRTFRRALNAAGYNYCRSRKKGLLKNADVKKRLEFCKKLKNDGCTETFWRNSISFYLDGTGFIYKQNPKDQATAPKAREWRKRCEGLSLFYTAKGKEEGSTQAKFMVAIACNKGVVMCEQCEGSISGSKFAKLCDNHFPQAFMLSANPHDKLFLQDGDPSQNSAKALPVLQNMGQKCFQSFRAAQT